MLRAIGYLSSTKNDFEKVHLVNLINKSKEKNSRLGITGVLLYGDGNILQFIEGEDPVVTDLMRKIASDIRHSGVIEVFNEEIDDRLFPDWSMAFHPLSSLPENLQGKCRDLMKLHLPNNVGGQFYPDAVASFVRAFILSMR